MLAVSDTSPNQTKEVMTQSLFARFASTVRGLSDCEVADPRIAPKLVLAQTNAAGRNVTMLYAPFDYVNPDARIVIVGLTPGLQQARNALAAARTALRRGATDAEAAAEAKVFASFSGPMRANLVAMLDRVGVARRLEIATTATLWSEHAHQVQFTSALRYPVMVNGENWSGQPNALRDPVMRTWLETYLGEELRMLPNAFLVPLGPKVADMLGHLASLGLIDHKRVLDGLPHPSGANAERIAYFLGHKSRESLSIKTDPKRLISARAAIEARLRAI